MVPVGTGIGTLPTRDSLGGLPVSIWVRARTTRVDALPVLVAALLLLLVEAAPAAGIARLRSIAQDCIVMKERHTQRECVR